MVKIEEDPDNKIVREIQDNISKIQSCLPSDCFFDRRWTENNGDFEGKIIEIIKKTEKHFFRKAEVKYTKNIAKVCFINESNSIFLYGHEDELMDIAQKLEDVGYNVTIWT